MKIRIIAFFLFTCFLPLSYAQKQGQALIDSLLLVLPSVPPDTIKAELLGNLCYSYYPINPDEGIRYGNEALELAGKLHWKRGLGRIYSNIGVNYAVKSEYSNALDCFFKANKILEEVGDKSKTGTILGNIANIYSYQSNLPMAMEYHFKALKINEENGYKRGIALNLNNIGLLYKDMSDYQKALEYMLKALKINEEFGSKNNQANNLAAIGIVYYKQSDNTKALEYYARALEMYEKVSNKDGIAKCNSYVGVIYREQSDYPKALDFLLNSLVLFKELKNKVGSGNSYCQIGDVYLSLYKDKESRKPVNEIKHENNNGLLQQAMLYIDSAIVLQREIEDLKGLSSSYRSLSEVLALLGNYQGAFETYQLYKSTSDSTFNIERDKKITQSVMKYEFEKKEMQATVVFERRQDSLKLENQKREIALEKEMQIKSLTYEYEKKQAAARTDKEKQQLRFEEELKRNKINFDYEQKRLALESEQKRQALIVKAAQQKKDAEALQELQHQRNQRNIFMIIGLGILILAGGLWSRLNYTRKTTAIIKKEKERSEALLLNILPEEVAEELKAKGSADAKQFDMATVMFTDFKGFTQLSEKLTPAELVAEIHTCFKAFDNIITRYNIEKIKTIGDSYMCAGGLPVSNTTHPVDVVEAATEIQQFMQAHLQQRKDENKEVFEIRIGIHTGPVVAGIVGVKKFAYDIWGDTVNIASRMESSGEAGKVNISSSTYELVKDKFHCIHRGKILAKNKGEIDMYFAERISQHE